MQDGQLVGVGRPEMRHGGMECAQDGGLGIGWGSCVAVVVSEVGFAESPVATGVDKSLEDMLRITRGWESVAVAVKGQVKETDNSSA
jgi:hypothetical protein